MMPELIFKDEYELTKQRKERPILTERKVQVNHGVEKQYIKYRELPTTRCC